MPTLIMTKGLPASGKSTWAKEQVRKSKGKIKRVNKDDLREMIDSGLWSKENEKGILNARNALILNYLSNGHDVIVDDTNLAPKHEEYLKNMAEKLKAEFEVKSFLDVPLLECIKRDFIRPNSVGEKVIRNMFKNFVNKPAVYNEPEFNEDLPTCIIVDIDGTLAHMTGRSPYDYSRVGEDVVDKVVRDFVNMEYVKGREIVPEVYVVIVSGRKSECFEQTQKWLKDNNIYYDELFMRADGDDREDSIVKKEIYENNIKPRFNVKYVLDDRDRVVKMWREQGLKVLQVAEGDF